MQRQIRDYLEFLKYSLDASQHVVPKGIKGINWHVLLDFAQKQAIVGAYWGGIQQLKNIPINRPIEDDVMEWMAKVIRIQKQNVKINQVLKDIRDRFTCDRFSYCILKGQGNAVLYPDPWSRTSGDIDVWVCPKSVAGDVNPQGIVERRKAVMRYVRRFVPDVSFRYHHVDFNVVKGVPVEVHFFPLYMNNPWANRRLQAWFEKERPKQFKHRVVVPDRDGEGFVPRHSEPQSDILRSFCAPTAGFNLVYQMCHILHHFFDDGIGLRQLIDYYYVLQQEYSMEERTEACRILKQLHIWKFVRAVMYIQQDVLGLDERYLLAEPDARRGEVLLDEIMKGGNFGRTSGLAQKPLVRKYFAKIVRNLRLVRMCPSEALWEPWFRTWHFFWRQYAKVRYS